MRNREFRSCPKILSEPVIPAKAGIQCVECRGGSRTAPSRVCRPDSRFRGNDGVGEHPFDANDTTTRGADGELRQPRFFDRALRTVKEYNEKVEYIHLNPVRAGLVSRREDWSRPAGSSYNEYAGMSADESVSRRTV